MKYPKRLKKSRSWSNGWVCATVVLIVIIIVYKSCVCVREWYDSRDPMLHTIHERLKAVDRHADKIRLFRGSKSYTLDKHKVYLCLRDEKGEYYHINMLMYVALHELAHCKCAEVGHTDSFFRIFDSLLLEAEKRGLYDPSIPPINDYCMSPNDDGEEEE